MVDDNISLQEFDSKEFDGTTIDGQRVYLADQVDEFLESEVRPTLIESFNAVELLKASTNRAQASQESVEIINMASALADEHLVSARDRAASIIAEAEDQKLNTVKEIEILKTRAKALSEYGESVRDTLSEYVDSILSEVKNYNIFEIPAPEALISDKDDSGTADTEATQEPERVAPEGEATYASLNPESEETNEEVEKDHETEFASTEENEDEVSFIIEDDTDLERDTFGDAPELSFDEDADESFEVENSASLNEDFEIEVEDQSNHTLLAEQETELINLDDTEE